MKRRNILLASIFLSATLVMAGCGTEAQTDMQPQAQAGPQQEQQTMDMTKVPEENLSNNSISTSGATLIDKENLFSDRDYEQEADLENASAITLESGNDVTITDEGVYVLTGTAEGTTIIVDADTAKVQLVLDSVTITNDDFPAIYIKSADKVFITTTQTQSSLSVTGTFTSDGETNTDAVIFSKDDVVFNGKGTLSISSTANGISGKDDVKFTGGSYNITSKEDSIEANESILISDGSFVISSEKDALHSENSDDNSVGSVYIAGGSFDIDAKEDGIQATTVLMIDGGTIDINASEGLEATYVQINGGTINISASDDGINAASKGSGIETAIEINGGELKIEMAEGDTDALDANGNLYINGGTIDITAQFAFDFDGKAEFTGGTVTVNGEAVTEITNSMMMGGGQGGFGGGPNGEMPGFGGQNGQMPDVGSGQKGDRQGFGERPQMNGENFPDGNAQGGGRDASSEGNKGK